MARLTGVLGHDEANKMTIPTKVLVICAGLLILATMYNSVGGVQVNGYSTLRPAALPLQRRSLGRSKYPDDPEVASVIIVDRFQNDSVVKEQTKNLLGKKLIVPSSWKSGTVLQEVMHQQTTNEDKAMNFHFDPNTTKQFQQTLPPSLLSAPPPPHPLLSKEQLLHRSKTASIPPVRGHSRAAENNIIRRKARTHKPRRWV